MQTKTKLKGVRERIFYHRLLGISVGALAVFLMAFTLIPTLIAEANAATDVDTKVSWNQVSLTLDPDYGNGSASDPGHGDVQFGEIVPTSVADGNIGTMRVIKKNIGITTNGQFYSVYLSMAGNTQSLILQDSTLEIEPINASWSSPSAFSETSWGFAVPSGDGVTTFQTPFTYTYSASYDTVLATDLTKTSHNSIYNKATWAQVPVVDTANNVGPQQIWKATCNTTNPQGHACATYGFETDSFPVYYGIMVDTDTMSGVYENEIVYTAMASSSSLDQVSKNINRSDKFVKQGTVETLSIDLSSSGITLTKDDVEVYLIPHNVAVANNYESTTTPNNLSTYKVAANKCTIGTNASDFVPSSTGLTLNCTLPASPNGVDDGTTTTHSSETSSGVQLGEFDIWLHVKNYNYDYISKYTKNTSPVASIVYAGLQSTDASGNKYITKMQEMTQTVCSQTNKWSTAIGTNARIYAATDTGYTNALATTAAASDEIGLGTFALTDTRDSKAYLVRRLADGNCWMVQNLDLELADFAGKKADNPSALTPENTDIAALGVSYYDPTEITNAKITGSVTAKSGGVSPSANFNVSGNLTASTFVGLAKYLLGTTVDTTEQFQSFDLANGEHFWGSKCTPNSTTTITSTSCDTSATPANTILSEIPRSYSNMVTSDNSTDFSKATQFRYVATNWETGKTRGQTMGTTYPTGAPAAWGNTAATVTTSTNAYVPAEKASSTSTYNYTGTGAQAYEAAADGSYYGTMYVGHYYNWYAATAESGSFSSSKTKDASICPAGWRLPQNGGTSTDYSWSKLIQGTYGLINKEGDQTASDANPPQGTAYGPAADMHKLPLSIPFTGYYGWQGGGLYNRGTDGYFWSSSVYGTTLARYLAFYSTYVYPQNFSNKVYGFTVRCVAR